MANPLLTGSDVSVGASRLSLARRSIGIQAAYYTLTGIWPIVHRRSFEAVTGRKTDYWLVQMVGALAIAIGGSLALAARRSAPSREAVALSVGSAAAFAAIDATHATRGRIRRVYLLDLAVESAVLVSFARTRFRSRVAAGR